MYCLLEAVSVYPEKLAARFVDKTEWIKSLMNSSKEEMRELAALFYSVVVSTVSGNELKSMIEQLIKTTKDNHVCYQFCLYSFLGEWQSFPKASVFRFCLLISKRNFYDCEE